MNALSSPLPYRERVVADGGLEPLPDGDDSLERIARGEVLIIRGALQALDLLDPLSELSLHAIAAAASPAAAERIRTNGFGSIHRHLSGPEIEAAYVGVTTRLRGREPDLIRRFAVRFAASHDDCYAAEKSWVRFFVPQDCYAENRARFSKRVGHLRLQNPHRDSWFTNPRNAVVLWAAMSPVLPGNGMLIYPRLWGRPIAHRDYERNGYRVDTALRPGRPIDFRLDPGDLLLFSGEHFHSSELNRTDQTRFVISLRLTPGAPRYGEGARWIPYRSVRHQANGHDLRAGLRCRLTPTYVRFLLERRLAYQLRRALSAAMGGGQSAPVAADADTEAVADRMPVPAVIELPELEPGAITPVSATHCAVLTDEGPILFERRCPHEGADLAGGWIDGGGLFCPWHNLRFALDTGRQPCRSLNDLAIRRLHRVAAGRYVVDGGAAAATVAARGAPE